MVIVSALYPIGPEDTFDMDYYLQRHIPMVRGLLEPKGLREVRVFSSSPKAAYPVIAELIFDDRDSVDAGLASLGPETMNDVPNYTNVTPIMQISERIH